MTRRVRGPLDGPLLPYGPGFEVALASRGYSADSIGRHLRLMVHLSRWLAEQHLTAGDLTAGYAQRFLRFRQAQGHAHPASMDGMTPLVDYLVSVGAAPAAEPQAAGPMDALIAQYRPLPAPGARLVAAVERAALCRRCPQVLGACAGRDAR